MSLLPKQHTCAVRSKRIRTDRVCRGSAVWLAGLKLDGQKVVKMLTPRFSLDQCEDHLTVKIYAPFTNVADTEVFFDEQDFRFYSRPYFLRLHLPAQVQVCSHPLYLNCDQNGIINGFFADYNDK